MILLIKYFLKKKIKFHLKNINRLCNNNNNIMKNIVLIQDKRLLYLIIGYKILNQRMP